MFYRRSGISSSNRDGIYNLDCAICKYLDNLLLIWYIIAKYYWHISTSLHSDSYIILNYSKVKELFAMHSLQEYTHMHRMIHFQHEDDFQKLDLKGIVSVDNPDDSLMRSFSSSKKNQPCVMMAKNSENDIKQCCC